MEEGAIASWLKKEGEFVEEGETIVEIETDKATMEYESPEEGTLLKIIVGDGQKCGLGDVICVLGEKGEDYSELLVSSKKKASPAAKEEEEAAAPAAQTSAAPAVSVETPSSSSNGRVKASPLAKKIAKDKNIDLAGMQGSGPNGRIIAKDLGNLQSAPVSSSASASFMSSAEDQKVNVSMMRSTIAKRLTSAKNDAPHFYLTRSANMEKLFDWRKSLNANLRVPEEKVSVNDLMVLCCAKTLARFPEVNSSWQGDHIIRRGGVHVAVAVATDNGLVTPVVKNADKIGLHQIAVQTKELIGQVKSGGQVDYTSGTFTISNLGMLGMEEFTAIINPPQAAILAVGATIQQPWVDEEGRLCVQKRMKMTMSCDHRVVDGAVGAKFLQLLVSYIENPLLMLG